MYFAVFCDRFRDRFRGSLVGEQIRHLPTCDPSQRTDGSAAGLLLLLTNIDFGGASQNGGSETPSFETLNSRR